MEWLISFLTGRSLLLCLVIPVMSLVRKNKPLPAVAWVIVAVTALFPAGNGVRFPLAKGVGLLWLAGVVVMAACSLQSYWKMKQLYQKSVPIGDGVFLCDYVPSGCILGYRNPKIYLNGNLTSEDAANILAHERMHLKRRDHIWKLLGYCLLILYWFHPLMYQAWDGFSRDLELECDEDLTWTMDPRQKRCYAQTLLNRCQGRTDIALSGFGDSAVGERIAALCVNEEGEEV